MSFESLNDSSTRSLTETGEATLVWRGGVGFSKHVHES